MVDGFRAWDAAANMLVDITTQTVKGLGFYVVGSGGVDTATGTITDARFAAFPGHLPFVAEIEGDAGGSNIRYAPVWTFSGNNLNWSYPVPSVRPRVRVLYGLVGIVA